MLQQPQEQRYPFLLVCAQYFRVSKQWYGIGSQCVRHLTCVQMLIHATARTRGLYGRIRESALKGDIGRKLPCHTRDSNPRQYCIVRESALEADTGRKLTCHIKDSNPRQYCIVRESALETDTGRKLPCHINDSYPHQYCTCFFGRSSTN